MSSSVASRSCRAYPCRRSGPIAARIGYTYHGASTAWRRAVKRAGVHNCHFNDLRAKALTDKEATEGMQQARRMGAHSTEAQTADYVRHRQAQRTEATR